MSFERLIRFVDDQNRTLYGNLEQVLSSEDIVGRTVQVVAGSLEDGFSKTSEEVRVKKLSTPLTNVPAVLCAGLNYHLHVKETNAFLPEKPVVFMTPAERLCGPVDEIIAHHEAQSMLDYEGELVLVFGKDAKDVQEGEALDYLLGFCVGNDVSARNLVSMEVAFNQMGHLKSFDTFGPMGPCVVSPRLINDPHQLQLVTKVNGQTRQNANTSDMIWKVEKLVSWVSRNRTIKKGTVFMTGTPSGAGWHSGGLLQDGDVVEVEISEIGSIKNKVVFL